MNGIVRAADGLPSIVERARLRGFAGLALDGIDVAASLAASKDAGLLAQAIDIASRGNEKAWAERFAWRLCECDPKSESRLTLASILTSLGKIDEARIELSEITAAERDADERYRQVFGILCAKEGRTDEAMAVFDTLSGQAEGYHPAPPVLTAAQEMISQCDLAYTTRLVGKLSEKYPDHPLIRGLHLRCHLYSGDLEKARELAQMPVAELEKMPIYDRRGFVEAVAEIYEFMGWTDELFEFTRDSIARDPTHWSLYGLAANAALVIARDKEYAEIVSAIPPESRDTAEALAVVCRWHVDGNRIEKGAGFLDDLRRLSAPLFLNASLYLQFSRHDQSRIDAVIETCRQCGIPLLGPALGYGLHAYYYNCTAEMLQNSLAKLEPFISSERTRAIFWMTYLRCLIGLGEDDKAAECYRSLPRGLADGAMLKPFSMFFDARLGSHEKARSDWTQYIRTTHHACVNARSSYPRTVQLKYSETPGAILLFLTVFNGGDYLDWFLDHYRKLGVDHFFITDNGSNDDTLKRLLLEPDVSVFFNPDSFAKSGFGVLWTNHLMQRFGVGHWCFHVDMDEGFVFPGCDNGRSLRDLLSYCDDRGFGLVPALAMDMYPENLETVGEADPFAASCYFDVDYISVPSELPPYVIIQGGLRRRLTGLATAMHKSSLVKMAPDVRYLECSHRTTHLPLADVSGAILHYKFIGDLKRRVTEAISRGEHFSEAISYQRLGDFLGASGWSGSLLSPNSRRYEGTQSLLRHGLMRSSAEWGI